MNLNLKTIKFGEKSFLLKRMIGTQINRVFYILPTSHPLPLKTIINKIKTGDKFATSVKNGSKS